MKQKQPKAKSNINWGVTIIPLCIVLVLATLFTLFPDAAARAVDTMAIFFKGDMGFFYILIGLAAVFGCAWLAFSKYGNVKLGNLDKPRYSTFSWGAMIFTSTMAADILFWSLHEWTYYFTAQPLGADTLTLAEQHTWASAYPLFHWGVTPWAFYILPAVAYGYMLHVKKRHRQTLSEACRPTLGKKTDGFIGKVIDVFSVMGLLVGTATTFALATPLLSLAATTIFDLPTDATTDKIVTIAILILIALVYTIIVCTGMKGISHLATICVVLFCVLVAGFFILGGEQMFIIESGITGIGKMINDFFSMSTWMAPTRDAGTLAFPQEWTVFFWAFWIAWCVATPFFIGKISEGRTIKQTILGGFTAGLLGTYTSFIILGNYGLSQQIHGNLDIFKMIAEGQDAAHIIIEIFNTLPFAKVFLLILILSMIAFYASTFDALTLVVAGYSMKNLGPDEEPGKGMKSYWAIVFIILPIGLIFASSALNSLTTLYVIAAFPIALILILVVYSFLKDLRKDYQKGTLSIVKEEYVQKTIDTTESVE